MNFSTWLVKFACFLNTKDYTISVMDIKASLQNFDCLNHQLESMHEKEIDMVAKVCWCKNAEQVYSLPSYRKMFMLLEDYKSTNKNSDQNKQTARSTMLSGKEKLDAQEQKELDDLMNRASEKVDYDKTLMSQYKDGSGNHDKTIDNIAKAMEDAMWDSDFEKAESLQNLLESTLKIKEEAQKKEKEKQQIINKYDKERKKLDDAYKQELREIAKVQKEIDKMLSKNHREEFNHQTANNAVKARFNGCAMDLQGMENKKLTSISKEDMHNLEHAIKKNAVAMYTRMMRNIRAMNSKKINIADTIKKACKTAGVPFEIAKTKPKRNKAELVLVLDISGSCIHASKVMLTFMHLLSSVFDKVTSYAFVNRLYDVTEIMNQKDTLSAVDGVMNKIQTVGVYSDYFRPLEDLYKNHKDVFKSDTMVIFIGDARNNRNPTGEEFFKNIARKVKKTYWLNTESKDEWDCGDSIASVYGKYCDMQEVSTIGDVVAFINNMR